MKNGIISIFGVGGNKDKAGGSAAKANKSQGRFNSVSHARPPLKSQEHIYQTYAKNKSYLKDRMQTNRNSQMSVEARLGK